MSGQLPFAPAAERSILGGILLDSSAFFEVADLLSAGDFSLDSNRRIWCSMAALAEDKIPIDVITLSDSLECSKDLNVVGGAPYIASLLDGVPDRPSLAYYAKMLKEASLRRAMIASINALCARMKQPGDSNAFLIESGQKLFNELAKEARLIDSYHGGGHRKSFEK
jgi:replicative DNA helicase